MTSIEQCLKSPVSEHPATDNMLKGPKDCEICMTALLSVFFINVSKTDWENVSLSDM